MMDEFKDDGTPRDAAIGWLVRMQSDAFTADDWTALTLWLDASPENLEAFEAIERLDADIVAEGPAIVARLVRPSAEILQFKPRQAEPAARHDHRRAIAAGLVAVAIAAGFAGWKASQGVSQVYATGPGAARAITLADGTRIHLDANSRLSVRLGWFGRRAKLEEALASFDVAKDSNRPFVIEAADQMVRVVGTEFVVRDYGRVVDVSVRRGVVSVSTAGGGPETRLTPGWSLRHVVNSETSETRRVDPDAAFAWVKGRLVCHKQPLGEIVAYLNHRYRTPIHLTAKAAALTFSGVLDLNGEEEDVVRRLAAYVSLTVHRSESGIVLD